MTNSSALIKHRRRYTFLINQKATRSFISHPQRETRPFASPSRSSNLIDQASLLTEVRIRYTILQTAFLQMDFMKEKSITAPINSSFIPSRRQSKNPPNHFPGHKNSKGFLLNSSSPSVYSEAEAPEAVIKPGLWWTLQECRETHYLNTTPEPCELIMEVDSIFAWSLWMCYTCLLAGE